MDKRELVKREEFPHLKQRIYLDAAAAGVYSKTHVDRFTTFLQTELLSNPHSGGLHGRDLIQNIIEFNFNLGEAAAGIKTELVSRIRHIWNISRDYEIVFTSNSSHAIKLASEILNFQANDLLILSQDNHTSMAGVRQE